MFVDVAPCSFVFSLSPFPSLLCSRIPTTSQLIRFRQQFIRSFVKALMRILQLGFLIALASGLSAILIYINGVTYFDGIQRLSSEEVESLQSLQASFKKCVVKTLFCLVRVMQSANGLGLQALSGNDYCMVTIKFPSDTNSKWKDPKTGEPEGLLFEFNLCEAVANWEQVRSSTTILTKEFIDTLPNGWEDYAWRRINKGIQLNRCQNKTLCMEKLKLVLPETPPYVPKQFNRCAVIGNSGDLLKTRFGKEIDGYDVVIRENGAPIQNYTEYVGKKSTFRLLNRGSAKALDKVVELDESKREALIIKTTIHDIMNQMIQEVPIRNDVYLMLGASFGSAAKGTGLKALEFALSMCESVDMYGFTVDPGYKEWTRYFSESRKGHTPLHGRAYYQMMECLGLIKIHSPMRADPNRVVKGLPSRSTISAARSASEKLLRRIGAGSTDPLRACEIRKQVRRRPAGVQTRSKAALDHEKSMKGTTMYPLEHNPGHGMLCTFPTV
ncbi:Sialyltransferase-like protein 2 [Linum perenne]